MVRERPKTYYGYTGRFRNNVMPRKRSKTKPKKSLKKAFEPQPEVRTIEFDYIAQTVSSELIYECDCCVELALVNGVFPDHKDNFGNHCDGSGQPPEL